MPLKKIRREIDTIDKKIVRLLNKRAGKILAIGRVKKERKASIYAPAREKEIFMRLARENKGPLTPDTLKAIYREIMSASFALEKPLTIAYLGPAATFTHLAAMKRFGSSVAYPCVADA